MAEHVELPDAAYRRSSRSSGQGQCVEVANTPRAISVRDSKDPRGPKLSVGKRQFRALVQGVKAGRFDL